jgi:predicted amidophosphoribosyltransferase
MPAIPARFWQIDATNLDDHSLLSSADRCYYLWEYVPRRGYGFSPTNQLIRNLKIKPSLLVGSCARSAYKRGAIAHAAAALRHLISREFVEMHATFVPMPCSKAIGDPDYDDRMARVLEAAFEGWSVDLRQMLAVVRSIAADHACAERLSYETLLEITHVIECGAGPSRAVIVIVDDVLNSGKHYRVARELLSQRYPRASVRGVFLARCMRERLFSRGTPAAGCVSGEPTERPSR